MMLYGLLNSLGDPSSRVILFDYLALQPVLLGDCISGRIVAEISQLFNEMQIYATLWGYLLQLLIEIVSHLLVN
jgi:hypothetical protein